MDIADRFFKYFTNIGPNLARAIQTVSSATFQVAKIILQSFYNRPPILVNWKAFVACFRRARPLVMIIFLCMVIAPEQPIIIATLLPD